MRKGPLAAKVYRTDYVILLESKCWVWMGNLFNGRPRFLSGQWVHIVFYIERYGTYPKGWELHHKCFNRRCVNPSHLKPMPKSAHKRIRHKSPRAVAKRLKAWRVVALLDRRKRFKLESLGEQ